MVLDAGAMLGPYRVIERIGSGGMGSVYKAHDTRLDRTVAIKALNSGGFSERFERESKVLASLNHPNICHIHDVGPNYLVLEYIDGKPIEGPLPLDEVVRLGAMICDALGVAHDQGLVHRDLKPGNILATAGGVKVIDFGLAKASEPKRTGPQDVTLTKTLTGDGFLLGTVPYMAPEQLHGHDADSRSDIFALGCVLYEMYTGRRAFSGESQASIVAAIIERDPTPLREFQPAAPAWFERLVRRCLKKKPAERWQSARDIAIELRDPPAEPQVAAQAPRRTPWIAAGAVLAGVTALVLAGWLLRPGIGLGAAPASSLRFSVLPPEGARFRYAGLAVSPDGSQIAFSALKGGKPKLWVRSLRSGEYRELEGTGQGFNPFWSSDGKHIGFFDGGLLKRIPAQGGLIRTVCVAASGTGGWWEPNGQIYFTVSGGRGIFRVREAGGAPEIAFAVDGARGFPALLSGGGVLYLGPDGVRSTLGKVPLAPSSSYALAGDFLFTLSPGTDRSSNIVGQRLDPKLAQLTGEPVHTRAIFTNGVTFTFPALAGSPSGALVYWGGLSPSRISAWVGLDGVVEPIPGPGYMSPDLSPDGKRVAYPMRGLRVQKTGDPANTGLELTVAGGRCCHSWSPDGKWIAVFARSSNGVVVVATDGSGKPRLAIPGETGAMDWSPDGKWLIFSDRTETGGNDIGIFPIAEFLAGNPAKPLPFLASPASEKYARLSHDGKWIAYTSDVSGIDEIYVRPFDGAPAGQSGGRLVSQGGGSYARWSRDGKQLFYLSSGQELNSVAVNRQGTDISFDAPRALFELPEIFAFVGAYPYDVTSDGKRFLVTREPLDAPTKVIQVITNVAEDMSRKSAN